MAAALDDLDRNILALLQQDASLPLDEIARQVGRFQDAGLEPHPQDEGLRA